VHAADFLNAGQFEVVSLQHEFGIFGGETGDHVMALLSRLTMPIITTLHTVLSEPTPVQRGVLDRIVDASSRVVVMAEKGRKLLRIVSGWQRKRSRSSRMGFPPSHLSSPTKRRPNSASAAGPSF
jgi:hypothetical protein